MFSIGNIKTNDNSSYMEGFSNNLNHLMDGGRAKRLEKFRDNNKKKSTLTKILDRFNRVDEHFFDENDHSMKHMKHKIKEYYNSFDREEFTDTPKNSKHALKKFKYFQKSFWNIFKD